jgi:hypothetical protein
MTDIVLRAMFLIPQTDSQESLPLQDLHDCVLKPLAAAASDGSLTPSQAAEFKQRLHSECLPALAAAAVLVQQQLEQRPWAA